MTHITKLKGTPKHHQRTSVPEDLPDGHKYLVFIGDHNAKGGIII